MINPYGNGIYHRINGNICDGLWEKGEMTKGKMTYKNGEIYEGEWAEGKKHGKGKFIYENGDI